MIAIEVSVGPLQVPLLVVASVINFLLRIFSPINVLGPLLYFSTS